MPDYKTTYASFEKYQVCIFIDTDVDGNITESLTGRYIVPDRQYQYFFYADAYVGDSLLNYKVVQVDNVPQLQAIDLALEEKLKSAYFGSN